MREQRGEGWRRERYISQARKSSAGRGAGRGGVAKRPRLGGEKRREKGRPGESAGAKGEGRRKERGVQKAKRPTKGALHSKSEEGRQRERVISQARKSSAGRWGRRCAKRPRPAAMGSWGAKKGWANRGGGVAKRPRLGEKRREERLGQ